MQTKASLWIGLALVLALVAIGAPCSARETEMGGGGVVRYSEMGADVLYDAANSAAAYNSAADEYLLVWEGDDNGGQADDEGEIWAQRVDAATGLEIGAEFRVSDMGPDGDALYDATEPAVAYNSTDDEYLVVWQGDDNAGGLVEGENEIFGQRLDGASGAEIGTNDFRLSDMGPDGDANYDAFSPAVTFNTGEDEYLVVWHGEDNSAPLVDGETEIFYQRVDGATGSEIGTNDFRVSDMGNNGDTAYDAFFPEVAYNSVSHEYLVVWQGDDNVGPLADNEYEVFCQRLHGGDGSELGNNDFRISDAGPEGDPAYDAMRPTVAYNVDRNEYLVAWSADDSAGGLVDDELEVYGQRLDGAGGQLGADTRLSDAGPDGDAAYDASSPAVAYSGSNGSYMVVWNGDDNAGGLVEGETEILAQRVDAATGSPTGSNDFRLSDMGPNGDTAYAALTPAVALRSSHGQYLVAWNGDDDTGALVDGEYEMWGQRVRDDGNEILSDVRYSDMGSDDLYDALDAAVAYNPASNEYLVVWAGDDNHGTTVDSEHEIFGRRVDAGTGLAVGEQFRLSDMGPDGHTGYQAMSPAVAYSSVDNQYLVVWSGSDDNGGLVPGEMEIFGQRVSAIGTEIGADVRLSDMGPDGDEAYDANVPDVVYNPTANEYLVVWSGDDEGTNLVEDEFEIFGQRVDAATGLEMGDNDVRLSNMGYGGEPAWDGLDPAVAYNSTANEYMVVWRGDTSFGGSADDEFEIYTQRVAADGSQVGQNDRRISDAGADNQEQYDADLPDVAYAPSVDEYLVVWRADDPQWGTIMVDDEFEIFGQRLSGADGSQVGQSDFRLSDAGPDGTAAYQAGFPSVAYEASTDQYLVAWNADDDTPPLVDDESEIFGQRVDAATGAEMGDNDFQISFMGPTGNPDYDGMFPALACSSAENRCLAAWQGEDNGEGMGPGEYEIFGLSLRIEPPSYPVYLPLVAKGY